MSLPIELGDWRSKEALQQPTWPNPKAVESAREELERLPPLIFAGEARRLEQLLGRVSRGEAFLLQAGDCAESFDDFSAATIRDKLKIILQMSLVLTYGAGVPVVKVGRMAGQFAKPRSSPIELVGKRQLPAFRGHIVNSEKPTVVARTPNARRMLTAYNQSSATLNLLRAFTSGGLADLSMMNHWNFDMIRGNKRDRRYGVVAEEIAEALEFMEAIGVVAADDARLRQVEFFTSHESLLFDYEDPLTRRDTISGDWYDCSAHMLWVGERTRHVDGAHVAFLSNVRNPVGCKIGPDATPDDVLKLCERLNPDQIEGRLTLVCRMGANRISTALPPIIRAVRDSKCPVVWACDPMHGNTTVAANGHKTRHFETIKSEVEAFFAIHHAEGTWPGGLHIELTGDDVTECLGGSQEIDEEQLTRHYTTLCDPRLNARQSLEIAFGTAALVRNQRRKEKRLALVRQGRNLRHTA